MAGADKFGNIYFARLPQDVSDEIEEDPTGGKIKWEQGKLNGAPNKVEEIVQFHIGDVVNSLQKASLIPGGGECIIYGTVMGSVGALLPFTSRDDVDFFSHLEMHLRQDHPPLCGRDHMSYRSAYFPVKVSQYRWSHLIMVSQHQFKMLLKPLSCFKLERFIACNYLSQ
jgi:splicing factor 3B subunit 3